MVVPGNMEQALLGEEICMWLLIYSSDIERSRLWRLSTGDYIDLYLCADVQGGSCVPPDPTVVHDDAMA